MHNAKGLAALRQHSISMPTSIRGVSMFIDELDRAERELVALERELGRHEGQSTEEQGSNE